MIIIIVLAIDAIHTHKGKPFSTNGVLNYSWNAPYHDNRNEYNKLNNAVFKCRIEGLSLFIIEKHRVLSWLYNSQRHILLW